VNEHARRSTTERLGDDEAYADGVTAEVLPDAVPLHRFNVSWGDKVTTYSLPDLRRLAEEARLLGASGLDLFFDVVRGQEP
jgi:hypothetical protein